MALTQGHFRQRHNQVLRKLAEQLVKCTVGANNSSDPLWPNTAFIKPGEAGHRTVAGRSALLFPGKCWEMHVDLDKQLLFPTEVTQTSQRPDVVMWSTAATKFLIIELLCVLGGGNFKRSGGGCSATTHPAEARCRPLLGGRQSCLCSVADWFHPVKGH